MLILAVNQPKYVIHAEIRLTGYQPHFLLSQIYFEKKIPADESDSGNYRTVFMHVPFWHFTPAGFTGSTF